MPQVQQTIVVDGITVPVVIERKAIKHINARLHRDTLYISAPHRIADAELDKVIPDLARRLLRRVQARRANTEQDVLALAQAIATRFPQSPAVKRVWFVTTQQARWGSYSTLTHDIRLHAVLRHMPRWVLEAVIAHELAHAIHPNHSAAFWSLLRQVYPDTDRANTFLEGVAWLGQHWESIPEVERTLLLRGGSEQPSDVPDEE